MYDERGVRYSFERENEQQNMVTYKKLHIPTGKISEQDIFVDSLMYLYQLLSIWNSMSDKWKLYV